MLRSWSASALLPLALVACSGGSADGVPDVTGSAAPPALGAPGVSGAPGAIDLRRCGRADEPALARCVANEPTSSFALAACGDLAGDNTIDVDGNVATTGGFTVSSPARFGSDAWIGGRLDVRNALTVRGTLYTDAPQGKPPTAGAVVAATTTPLLCERAPDPAAIVRKVREAGVIDQGSALEHVREPAEVWLGCGRYRFTSIGADNTLTIHVEGRTVIVVDGDVRAGSPLRIELAPTASLDLVVGGSLAGDNTVTIEGGSTWLAVAGRVRAGSPMKLDGWLVAPRSEVAADNTLDVRGAVYARSLRAGSPVRVTRGRPLLAADGCVVP